MQHAAFLLGVNKHRQMSCAPEMLISLHSHVSLLD